MTSPNWLVLQNKILAALNRKDQICIKETLLLLRNFKLMCSDSSVVSYTWGTTQPILPCVFPLR